MTKRCYVLSEGQTEEAFVNQVVRPHLEALGFVSVRPVVIETKRLITGGKYKGGVSSWSQLKREILLLANDSSALTTTMVDLYGLPTDVPGWTPAHSRADGRARAESIERALAGEIDRQNFLPFVMVHEFEALLYVDPEAVAAHFNTLQLALSMNADLSECGEPELVNDSPETAPSKRIMRHEPAYVKTSDGPTIAGEIGLGALRSACPHLDAWMSRMEAWTSA